MEASSSDNNTLKYEVIFLVSDNMEAFFVEGGGGGGGLAVPTCGMHVVVVLASRTPAGVAS